MNICMDKTEGPGTLYDAWAKWITRCYRIFD